MVLKHYRDITKTGPKITTCFWLYSFKFSYSSSISCTNTHTNRVIYYWLIHTYIWSERIWDGWERGPRIRFICYVTRQLLLFVRLLRWTLSLKHVASSDLGCTLAISSDLLSFSLTADENNYNLCQLAFWSVSGTFPATKRCEAKTKQTTEMETLASKNWLSPAWGL